MGRAQCLGERVGEWEGGRVGGWEDFGVWGRVAPREGRGQARAPSMLRAEPHLPSTVTSTPNPCFSDLSFRPLIHLDRDP